MIFVPVLMPLIPFPSLSNIANSTLSFRWISRVLWGTLSSFAKEKKRREISKCLEEHVVLSVWGSCESKRKSSVLRTLETLKMTLLTCVSWFGNLACSLLMPFCFSEVMILEWSMIFITGAIWQNHKRGRGERTSECRFFNFPFDERSPPLNLTFINCDY